MATNGLRRRNTGDSKNNANTMTADEYATQHDLFGPISGALLVDPVKIQGDGGDGAYERKEITIWINQSGTSPINLNKRITVADLVPDPDKQTKIRELVRRYPDAQIVKDWLKEQPAWYTQAIQRIRNTGTPVVQAMSRAIEPVRQVMPSADTCLRCCAKTAETGAGAVVGAGVGACAGCMCALSLATNENTQEMSDEEKTSLMAFLTPTGAAVGSLVGAVIGPEECLRCAGEACKAACEAQGRYGGSRRKTRKGKRKKRRKTRKRKRKRKQTIKKKRRGRKSMKRTKRRKKH
jgi:hypothetical protein